MYVSGYNYENYEYLHLKKLDATIEAVNATKGILYLHTYDSEDIIFLPLQFHFHSPSEHTIDEKHFDLEMHVVH